MSLKKVLESELGKTTKNCESHGEYESEGKSFMGTEIWSPCPACAHDREIEQAENARAEKDAEEERKLERFYEETGIVKRYRGLTLANFNPKPSQKNAHELAEQFCVRFDEMANRGQTIVFPGNIGTGKTRLACAIIQTLGFGKYIRAIDISRDIRATYSSNAQTEREVVQSYVDQPLLVVDEVGVQMGTEKERIFLTDIIDRRYGDLHPTIICSNLNESQLTEVFGARAWSRLKQNYLICPIVGDDLRNGDNQ